MTPDQQAAQQMRREVKGLCYQCGEPLPAKLLQLQWLADYPRQEFGLCNPCWCAWKYK